MSVSQLILSRVDASVVWLVWVQFDPLRATFIWENLGIYLHFPPFLKTEMAYENEIFPHRRHKVDIMSTDLYHRPWCLYIFFDFQKVEWGYLIIVSRWVMKMFGIWPYSRKIMNGKMRYGLQRQVNCFKICLSQIFSKYLIIFDPNNYTQRLNID